jgi:hypothetical protein
VCVTIARDLPAEAVCTLVIQKLTSDDEERKKLANGRLMIGVDSEEDARVQLMGSEIICRLIGATDWILFSTTVNDEEEPPPAPAPPLPVNQPPDVPEVVSEPAPEVVTEPVPEPVPAPAPASKPAQELKPKVVPEAAADEYWLPAAGWAAKCESSSRELQKKLSPLTSRRPWHSKQILGKSNGRYSQQLSSHSDPEYQTQTAMFLLRGNIETDESSTGGWWNGALLEETAGYCPDLLGFCVGSCIGQVDCWSRSAGEHLPAASLIERGEQVSAAATSAVPAAISALLQLMCALAGVCSSYRQHCSLLTKGGQQGLCATWQSRSCSGATGCDCQRFGIVTIQRPAAAQGESL